jgi:hypothetical protein
MSDRDIVDNPPQHCDRDYSMSPATSPPRKQSGERIELTTFSLNRELDVELAHLRRPKADETAWRCLMCDNTSEVERRRPHLGLATGGKIAPDYLAGHGSTSYLRPTGDTFAVDTSLPVHVDVRRSHCRWTYIAPSSAGGEVQARISARACNDAPSI